MNNRAETSEWTASKRWNPFNSYKLLSHVSRWQHICRGNSIPPPALITVDPATICNFGCKWCNSAYVREHRAGLLSEGTLLQLADFLPHWGDVNGSWKPGVDAICIAGGGEPLLNPATAPFIDRVAANGIEIGVTTNGTMIHSMLEPLSQCTWVGISVDAGSPDCFNRLKMLDPEQNEFNKVINNIALLVDHARKNNRKLGARQPSCGVSYKYLVYRDNIGEIYRAARLAKEIGCKNIHFRPAGTTWDHLDDQDGAIKFTADEIRQFNEQIMMAFELDDDSFNVYGVTHKFNSQFDMANHFEKCHAIFMTAVIMPPSGKSSGKDRFDLGLCCDRRGDIRLELGADLTDPTRINELWGSEAHWKIHDSIRIHGECPRCTYQPHNQIYENVILNDSMTWKFI